MVEDPTMANMGSNKVSMRAKLKIITSLLYTSFYIHLGRDEHVIILFLLEFRAAYISINVLKATRMFYQLRALSHRTLNTKADETDNITCSHACTIHIVLIAA